MIKRIFSLKILLFSILSLVLFYPSATFAKEQCNDLFIYEKDILNQVSEKKEINNETELSEILKVKNLNHTLYNHFSKQIFNKFEKEIKQYNLVEAVSSYNFTDTNFISNYKIEEYIPRFKVIIEEPQSSIFITTLLEYRKTSSQESFSQISIEYLETLFAKESEPSKPEYSYFLESRAKPVITETKVYAQDVKTNETENTPPSTQSSSSTDVNFVLTILPVRFVYVENNEIIKIWNNVKKDDTQYVVKFLDENEKEITPSEKLYTQYFSIIEELDVFEHGTIYDENIRIIGKGSQSNIDIQVNQNSLKKEEIYTMI